MSAIERVGTTPTLDPRSRFLPGLPANGYHVGTGETLAAALHRLTTEQFSVAIDALSDPDADVTEAAETALDSIGRIVAVLRLVRSVIGDEAYRTERHMLVQTAERLDTLLDGLDEIRALEHLCARYERVLRPSAFQSARSTLASQHQLRRLQALSEGEALHRTLHSLRRARARFAAWPVEGDTARMYGREPVPDRFDSIAPGLAATYRRGRKQWQRLGEGFEPDAMAKLHRETSRLGHQLEILAATWPDVVGATAKACARLAEVLAEEQTMALLDTAGSDQHPLCPDPVERSLLHSLIHGSRQELQSVAHTLGARLYVEPTRRFIDRIEAYWDTRDLI